MSTHFERLFSRLPQLGKLAHHMEQAIVLLTDSIGHGGKVLTCGNGGSASDAEHIVGELMKSFLLPRPLPETLKHKLKEEYPQTGEALGSQLQQCIPAISLVSGVSLPTAFANDVNSDLCFAQQVLGLGRPGDVLWGISTSGNSSNVNQALRIARVLGLRTLGLTGREGGAMAELCDVELRVPANDTPGIQELHLPVYHALCAALEEKFFT